MNDARFEDGGEQALRLRAFDGDDLAVISGLVQDAVLDGDDLSYRPAQRRFALLINRMRWEHEGDAERCRALLVIEGVQRVQSQGIARDAKTVLSLLSLRFEPDEAPGGKVFLTFAGDGELALEVEALEVLLRDVTQPYTAISGQRPTHP